jgi:membrane fusion protein (multidrug efflux system)
VAAARVAASRTQVSARASDLDLAKLQQSYASVTAPIAGLVSRKNVEPGQFVQAGQTVMSIAADTDCWVVANFKETQLAHMKPGQPAEFTADSYKDLVFHGRVDSIAGATGARFALLPPDNSSGNFVKVTQRVPVKIVLAGTPDPDHPLRPGISVDVTVSVRD